MELTNVILGSVVTEKSERLKAARIHTLRVHPKATKVEIILSLRRHYGVEPEAVRIITVRPKRRLIARGKYIQKRSGSKRAIVTLGSKSKTLDLSAISS